MKRQAMLAGVAVLAGCGGGDASGARTMTADSSASSPAPSGVIDSAIPTAEALRRFRVGLPEVGELAGGAASRDALVRRFVRALESGDTAALRGMELTRGEFAYLVYPSSIYTRPPYEQQPEIVWMLSRSAGETGYRRLVERYAGHPLAFQDYACDEPPTAQGANRTWRNCSMRLRPERGEPVRLRLFGAIVERAGSFKFVNYANGL